MCVILDDEVATDLLARTAEKLARAEVPPAVADAFRQGRLVPLTKPGGGVRALVLGDVLRRLVVRTLAQQFGEALRVLFWSLVFCEVL